MPRGKGRGLAGVGGGQGGCGGGIGGFGAGAGGGGRMEVLSQLVLLENAYARNVGKLFRISAACRALAESAHLVEACWQERFSYSSKVRKFESAGVRKCGSSRILNQKSQNRYIVKSKKMEV